jgi:hypothetical protein
VSSFLWELHGTFHSTRWTHYLWVHFFGNYMEHFIPPSEHTICEFVTLGTPWNISFHKVNTLFVSSFFGELHGTFHSTKWTHYLWVHFLRNSMEHFIPPSELTNPEAWEGLKIEAFNKNWTLKFFSSGDQKIHALFVESLVLLLHHHLRILFGFII